LWREAHRLLQHLGCFRRPSPRQQVRPEVVAGVAVIRPGAQGASEMLLRLGGQAEIVKDDPDVVVVFRVIGLQAHGLAVVDEGLVRSPLLLEKIGQVEVGRSGGRIYPERLAEGLLGPPPISHAGVGQAELVPGLGIGDQFQRFLKITRGPGEVAPLQPDASPELKRSRAGRDGQGILKRLHGLVRAAALGQDLPEVVIG
jgi:hypothetical protein